MIQIEKKKNRGNNKRQDAEKKEKNNANKKTCRENTDKKEYAKRTIKDGMQKEIKKIYISHEFNSDESPKSKTKRREYNECAEQEEERKKKNL